MFWEYCASGRRRTGVDRITNINVRGPSKSRGLICLLLGLVRNTAFTTHGMLKFLFSVPNRIAATFP